MSGRLIINGLNMHLALLGILSIKQQSGVANDIVRYFDLLEDLEATLSDRITGTKNDLNWL